MLIFHTYKNKIGLESKTYCSGTKGIVCNGLPTTTSPRAKVPPLKSDLKQ